MNERIKELAVQAGLEMCGCGCEMPTRQSATFAELLIRECTNMLPNDSIRNEEGVHMFYVIRQHFGVPVIGR